MLTALAGCAPAQSDMSDDELLGTLPDQVGMGNQSGLSQSDYTPNGTVLLDNGTLKITVDDLRVQEYGAVDVDLFLENTGDQSLTVSALNCSVNGYMVGASFYCDVSAQNDAQETLILYTNEVATELGLTDLADLSVSFSISAPDGSRTVTDPCTLTTPTASLYDYSSLLLKALRDSNWIIADNHQLLYAATDPLYDQDGLSLPVACLVRNAFDERELKLELYNTAADKGLVELGNISLNSTVLSGESYSFYFIAPGKRYLATINLDDLANSDPQGDYSQLREISFTLNGEAVTITVSQ